MIGGAKVMNNDFNDSASWLDNLEMEHDYGMVYGSSEYQTYR